MRITALILAIRLTSALSTTDSSNEALVPRQAQTSSPCVQQCLNFYPLVNNCVDFPQELQSCILSECGEEDALVAKKLQADICDYPNHNMKTLSAALLWTLFAVSVVFVALRTIGRIRALGGAGYGMDDFLLYTTCLPMIGVTVAGWLGIENGIGRDVWQLSVAQVEYSVKLTYIGQPLYIAVVYGSKISFVLLYMRIWKESIAFRRTCQCLLVLLTASLIAFVLTAILQCTPISYNWTSRTGGDGSCVDRQALFYANGSWNIALDVVVLLLPIKPIIKLQLHWPKKIMLLSVFSVGVAVIACAIVRLHFVDGFVNSTNMTWDYTFYGGWSIIEVYLSIICCCVPMVAGMLQRMWIQGKWITSKSNVEEPTTSTGSPMSMAEDEKRITRMDAHVGGLGLRDHDLESGKMTDSSQTDSSPSGRSDSSQTEAAGAESSDDEGTTITSSTVYGLAAEKLMKNNGAESFMGGTNRGSSDAYSVRSWEQRPLSQSPSRHQAELAVMFSPRHIRRPTTADSERPPSRGRSTRERSLPGSRQASSRRSIQLQVKPTPAILSGEALASPPPGWRHSTNMPSLLKPDADVITSGASPCRCPPPGNKPEPGVFDGPDYVSPPPEPRRSTSHRRIPPPLKPEPGVFDGPNYGSPPPSSHDERLQSPDSTMSRDTSTSQNRAAIAEAMPPFSIGGASFPVPPPYSPPPLDIGEPVATPPREWPPINHSDSSTPFSSDEEERSPDWYAQERRCQQKAGETAGALAMTAFEMGDEMNNPEFNNPEIDDPELTKPDSDECRRPQFDDPDFADWYAKEKNCQQKAGNTAGDLALLAGEIGSELQGTELGNGMVVTPTADGEEREDSPHDSAHSNGEEKQEDHHATGTQLTTPADWAPVKPHPHENPLRSQGRSSLFGAEIVEPQGLPATSSKRSSPTITDSFIQPRIIRQRSSSENRLAARSSSQNSLARKRSSANLSSLSRSGSDQSIPQRSNSAAQSRKGSSPTILDDLVMRAQARREKERGQREWGSQWTEIPDWRNIDTL